MDLSSCLELRSSPCVTLSASLANGFGNGLHNGVGKWEKSTDEIEKGEDDVEGVLQRPGFNLVSHRLLYHCTGHGTLWDVLGNPKLVAIKDTKF